MLGACTKRLASKAIEGIALVTTETTVMTVTQIVVIGIIMSFI
jgi:hypothetical protein